MKISIVIPCYNVEKTLRRCIESIKSQDFINWELILVDDGSTDMTGSVCDEYALSDERIHVIHKKNGGVSSARNAGIEGSHCDYITFIDADDYIEDRYLSKLINGREADLVLCGFRSDRGIDFTPEGKYVEKHELNDVVPCIVEDNYLLYSPWCKLFKRSLIEQHNCRFDSSLRLGEDTIFCYKYILLCETIRIVPSNDYFYIGEWGGGDKYRLSYNEVINLDTSEIQVIKQINQKFNCNIDLTLRGFHIGMLANLYKDYTDIYTWEIYCKTHGYVSEEIFFSNKTLSYIFWGIIELEKLYKLHHYKEGRRMMADLYNFMTIPTSHIPSYTLKMRILHWNIRHKFWIVNDMMLKLLNI